MKADRMRLWADLSLLAVSVLWGGTFLVVKQAIDSSAVQPFLCVRFAIAAVVLAAAFPRTLAGMTVTELRVGVLLGLFLWAGYAFQTAGLRWLDSSKAAFLTGVGLVLVPIAALCLGRLPAWAAVMGTLIASVGLTMMSLKTDAATGSELLVFGPGEWLLMGCAASFAFHIVIQGDFAPVCDVHRLAVVQIATTALLAGLASALHSSPWEDQAGPADWPTSTWTAVVFLAVFATALAFTVQVWAQRLTPPTHTALLLTLEPLSAALFGWWAGETLSPINWAGCVLIIVGILAAELRGSSGVAEPGHPTDPLAEEFHVAPSDAPSSRLSEKLADVASAKPPEKPV